MPSIERLEKLLAADPQDTFVLYGLAQEHAKAGSHLEALRYYDRCLAVDPRYCYAYFHKARSQEAMDEREAARRTLRDGLKASRGAGDDKALGEIAAYLEELGG